jgi:hypothetical protein
VEGVNVDKNIATRSIVVAELNCGTGLILKVIFYRRLGEYGFHEFVADCRSRLCLALCDAADI